jgi:NADPH:quinone reductase
MPKAVIASAFGPPESYALAEHDPGPPGPGQVRVAIKAAGISFVDVLTAAGEYQVKPPLPFIPGSEFAGVVEGLGEGVCGLAIGDKVMGSNWGGVFAESGNFRAANLRVIPGDLSFAEAAVLPVSYQTAHYALAGRAQLKAGETLLVLGAGGATGYAAVQLGKHFGARVIASASSPEKRALALKGGADAAIDARATDWRGQIKALIDGKGVDVVFDPVGGEASEPAFRSLGWNGRHLIVGFPGGIASLRTNLPLLKGASLMGVDIRQFGINEPEAAAANVQAVFALAAVGVIRPAIAKTYPLGDFVVAMQDAAAGKRAGRVLLVLDDQ